MIDIQLVRDNPAVVKEKSLQKGVHINVDELLRLDSERLELLKVVERLRQKRNDNAQKMKGGKPDRELVDEGKRIKVELADREGLLNKVEADWLKLMRQVPNMPLDEVPVGVSEDQNVVVREVGTKPAFGFEVKNHEQIAVAKGWMDKDRASKIAAARFVYLKGDLVLLEFALWQFGLQTLTDRMVLAGIIKNAKLSVPDTPFTPVLPPAVAKQAVFEATGRLNKQEQTYKIEDEDLWLNASAEHTMSPMYLQEIIPEHELPIRLVGYTTAFRREAGTYGKDTEGIFRMHQFNKLEMECFTTAETSYQEHLFLVAIQEYLMQQLELPYRVLEKCTADIGGPNAKGVDIDVWLPSQQRYRETHTADYITDYQARAMQTRVRRQDGSIELAHTNDATAFSERPLIAILENYQTAEGDVRVPKVLQPFMNGKELL